MWAWVLPALAAGLTPSSAAAEWQALLSVRGSRDGVEYTRVETPLKNGGGRVDFGAVNALSADVSPKNLFFRGLREAAPKNGKFLVATFVLKVSLVNGPGCPVVPRDCVPPGQTVHVMIHQTPVSFAPSRLRYALGKNTVWDKPAAGKVVPEAPTLLRAGAQDGDEILHQVALYVAEDDLAGEKTMPVHYSIQVGKTPW